MNASVSADTGESTNSIRKRRANLGENPIYSVKTRLKLARNIDSTDLSCVPKLLTFLSRLPKMTCVAGRYDRGIWPISYSCL